MIAIVDYGMGNLRSVQKACETVGGQTVVTDDPKTVLEAEKVILPGVGAFRDAMKAMREHGLDVAVKEAARQGKPLLGVCLGYQMLFDRSFEDGEHHGLGLVRGNVRLMESDGLKIPHMGWNALHWAKRTEINEGIAEGENVYFVHSYAAYDCDPSDILATTEYGMPIIAAIAHGNITGFQFHPEKSGGEGLKLLSNFIRSSYGNISRD